MSASQCRLPRIPSHYYVYCDPPDKSGEEVLHFVSSQRRVKLKGRSFSEFVQQVVPLLDGRHSFAEVLAEVNDLFRAEDLAASLDLLLAHGLLEDPSDWQLIPALKIVYARSSTSCTTSLQPNGVSATTQPGMRDCLCLNRSWNGGGPISCGRRNRRSAVR